jgi:hypothetical protein
MKNVFVETKWKNILYSRVRRITIVKMSIIPKAIYKLNAVSTKIPMASFREVGNNTKIYMVP